MGAFAAVPAPAALRGRCFPACERGVRGGYMRADGWWGLESSGRSLRTESYLGFTNHSLASFTGSATGERISGALAAGASWPAGERGRQRGRGIRIEMVMMVVRRGVSI